MLESLNRSVVFAGALMCMVIAVPAVVAIAALTDDGDDDPSNWVFLALFAVVTAYLLGGALAGRAVPHAPFINGSAASLLAFVLVQGLFVVLILFRGESFNVVALVFNGLLAASFGTVGAWIGARWGRKAPGPLAS